MNKKAVFFIVFSISTFGGTLVSVVDSLPPGNYKECYDCYMIADMLSCSCLAPSRRYWLDTTLIVPKDWSKVYVVQENGKLTNKPADKPKK